MSSISRSVWSSASRCPNPPSRPTTSSRGLESGSSRAVTTSHTIGFLEPPVSRGLSASCSGSSRRNESSRYHRTKRSSFARRCSQARAVITRTLDRRNARPWLLCVPTWCPCLSGCVRRVLERDQRRPTENVLSPRLHDRHNCYVGGQRPHARVDHDDHCGPRSMLKPSSR